MATRFTLSKRGETEPQHVLEASVTNRTKRWFVPTFGKEGVTVEAADETSVSFAFGLLHPQIVILSDVTVARGDWSKQTWFQKLLGHYRAIPDDNVLTTHERTLFGTRPVERRTLQIPLGTATEERVLGEIALAISFTD